MPLTKTHFHRLLLALAVLTAAAVWPPAEAFQQQASTGVLTGRILSDDGQPVDRAIVAILGSDRPGVRAIETDAAGEFSMGGLPAGSFAVWSTKPGFLTSIYGSTRSGEGPATPVALAAAQRVSVSLTMLRGASIKGRITDASGRPLSQVSVRVRPASSPETAAPQTSKTDSDGGYRIFGLAPGDYLVEAWPPPAEGPTATYAPTFFPSVAVIDQAVKVSVSTGEQRDDVTFSLYRAASVSGKVVGPNGLLTSGLNIALVLMEPAAKPVLDAVPGATPGVLRAPVSETGEFTVPGVVPGTYALWARGDANSSTSRTQGPDALTLWGQTNVLVDGPDVSGLVLNLQSGGRVSGTTRIDAASQAPAMETPQLRLTPHLNSTALFVGNFVATPDSSGKFVFPSVPAGSYDLRTAPVEVTGSTADTWAITSAIASGQDVTEGTLDIRPGEATTGVMVTLAETEISGAVFDDARRPYARFPPLFFSVDPTAWTLGAGRVKTAQPIAGGRFEDRTFRLGGLPPGEYFVVPAPSPTAGASVDGAYLEQLAGFADRITITSGEKRRVDLTVASGGVPQALADYPGIWTTVDSKVGLAPFVIEGRGNSPAGELGVGSRQGWLVISQGGDMLRVTSVHGNRVTLNTVQYALNGQPVRNRFPFVDNTAPSNVTAWVQQNKLVSTIEVFLPGEPDPRHYVETFSISPEGILAIRTERIGFPDTLTTYYQKFR